MFIFLSFQLVIIGLNFPPFHPIKNGNELKNYVNKIIHSSLLVVFIYLLSLYN